MQSWKLVCTSHKMHVSVHCLVNLYNPKAMVVSKICDKHYIINLCVEVVLLWYLGAETVSSLCSLLRGTWKVLVFS